MKSVRGIILYVLFMSACSLHLMNCAQTVLDAAEDARLVRLAK